ncbi:MAG: hypothetical protein ACTSUZ_08190, partial [Candidatus Thorarchaeota archaeon]
MISSVDENVIQSMDLLRVELDIIPVEEGRVNYFTGHLIRGAFLNFLSEIDADLVTTLHSNTGMRPYSIQPVCFPFKGDQRNALWEFWPGERRVFRICSLSHEVNRALLQAVFKTQGTMIKIGETRCVVDAIRYEGANFKDIVMDATNANIFDFDFVSPTKFEIRSESFPMLFPMPAYVYGGLGSLWNRYAPPEVLLNLDEFVANVKSGLCVTKHMIRTSQVRIKGHIPVTGFLGKARFKI